MKVPDKCLECEHTIIGMEQVHDGFCKFHLDTVVRCDRFPAHYIVGCVCADIYCDRKENRNEV